MKDRRILFLACLLVVAVLAGCAAPNGGQPSLEPTQTPAITQPGPEQPQDTLSVASVWMQVIAGEEGLLVYASPDQQGDAIATLVDGEWVEVTAIEPVPDWHAVLLEDGTPGFVLMYYLAGE